MHHVQFQLKTEDLPCGNEKNALFRFLGKCWSWNKRNQSEFQNLSSTPFSRYPCNWMKKTNKQNKAKTENNNNKTKTNKQNFGQGILLTGRFG